MARKEEQDFSLAVEVLEAGTFPVSVLLLQHYHEIGLTERELVLLLQLQGLQSRGITAPSLQQLACSGALAPAEVEQLLERLSENGFIHSKPAEPHPSYSLRPLWRRLVAQRQANAVAAAPTPTSVLRQLERGLGRALSPVEMETAIQWVEQDGYPEELVLAALREAIFKNVLRVRYIDRILYTWKQQGIHTAEEAAAAAASYRRPVSEATDPAPVSEEGGPPPNWLRGAGTDS